jgi:hypothetical protein
MKTKQDKGKKNKKTVKVQDLRPLKDIKGGLAIKAAPALKIN